MRKTLLAALVVLAAQSGWAAVQYEFVQSSHSDIEQIPPTRLTGRAIIDGERSRVDFVSGNIYAPGAYVISTNGSKTLSFVDPVSKSYSEVNSAALALTYGSNTMEVSNLKTNLELLPDQAIIAGIPTTHYHLTITYELTLHYGSMPLRQLVREDIEKWTSTQFGDVLTTFFAGGMMHTGNVELDKIIDAEATGIKGFPLRQKITISTTNPRGVAPGSKLALSTTRSQQRDLQVQSIKQVRVDPSVFAVPSAFQRVDGAQPASLTKQTQVNMLNFEEKQ